MCQNKNALSVLSFYPLNSKPVIGVLKSHNDILVSQKGYRDKCQLQ